MYLCWTIHDYSFFIKMTTKNETWDAVTVWLFIVLFHLFSFACWRISFCFQFFSFKCYFDFFYQWWQIIKRNAALFTKKSQCGWAMMNEWSIMSGLIWTSRISMWRKTIRHHYVIDKVGIKFHFNHIYSENSSFWFLTCKTKFHSFFCSLLWKGFTIIP